MATLTVIGLMSGTSMDGVDAAVLRTDGETIAGFGPRTYRPYSDSERVILRGAVDAARDLTDRTARPGVLAEAETVVTDAHVEAISNLLAANPAVRPELIGFHGQTVFHAPARKLTIQIGDGPGLAWRTGVPVVYDLRAADVAAGGEGAPLVPAYHRALAAKAGLSGDVVVVNVGGVANITRIAADRTLTAGDTGPGNALIDDWVRERTEARMDEGGALAAAGAVNAQALSALLNNPWFGRPLPKSLDRNAFSAAPIAGLSVEDGAATLAAFTAQTIADAIALAGGADIIVVTGGGASNPVLMRMLAAAAKAPVASAAEYGWSPDFIEAEAFAYLAARSLRGLPLTFPGTTGVSTPMTGGILAQPRGHRAQIPTAGSIC